MVVKLARVPKFLPAVKNFWCQKALVVGFKLETDEKLLLKKAKNSLDRSGHDVVVANLLQTRYKEVKMVFQDGSVETLEISEEVKNIETVIVDCLKQYHTRHMTS